MPPLSTAAACQGKDRKEHERCHFLFQGIVAGRGGKEQATAVATTSNDNKPFVYKGSGSLQLLQKVYYTVFPTTQSVQE